MNYNHSMEKYDLYGGYLFDKSQKTLHNFFHFVTHYEIVNVRHKKSSNRNNFFLVFGIAFFWNRESFIKMFTQSAYVSFFLFSIILFT